jgi:hypothetical protein
MPKGSEPSVFVSSTCYDLRQVRADMKQFIESLGYTPVLSEYPSFPIDPDIGTIENCLEAVENHANIFVLIIGGRYGSPTESGKSVTNLEYVRARAKGIPVYAFVQKSILDNLPVWKDNPEANFASVVDSPKLFEFVANIRGSGEIWVFPFDTAQDITTILRVQWASLFLNSLQIRMRVKSRGLSEFLKQLRGPALRLVIDQPLLWEARLFSQVLLDEIEQLKPLRRDLDYGIVLGRGEYIAGVQIIGWLSRKLSEVQRISSALTQLMNLALADAMKPDGVPAVPEEIVYVAKRLAQVYREVIEWTIELKRVHCDEDFKRAVRLTSEFGSVIVKDIEGFGSITLEKLEREVNAPRSSEEPRVIQINLTISSPDLTELNHELDRLRELYNS